MLSKNTMVLDANETAFWKRQLEHIKTRVFQVVYPELFARKAFPVSAEGGSGITSITYTMWDEVGIAKIIGNYATGIPRVDIKGTEHTVPVRRLADAFGMTIDEIRAAARTGRPLSAQKAMAARRGHEQTLNNIAYLGDSQYNLNGLFSHANIPWGYALTGDWTGGTTTAAQILADIKAGFGYIISITSGAEIPDAVQMPRTYFDHLAMTRISDYTDTTLLDWVISKVPYLNGPDSVIPYNEGEAVGSLAGNALASDYPVISYYRKDPEKLELEIPEDVNFLEPQAKGLEEETIVTMTCGGLNVYKPLSIYNQVMTPDPS